MGIIRLAAPVTPSVVAPTSDSGLPRCLMDSIRPYGLLAGYLRLSRHRRCSSPCDASLLAVGSEFNAQPPPGPKRINCQVLSITTHEAARP